MKDKKKFRIIYNEELYKIELPLIIFETEWKNYMSNPIKVRIHGVGRAILVNRENSLTDEVVGRTRVEIDGEFQIQSNASKKLTIILELAKDNVQIFECEKIIRVRARIPITYFPVGVPAGDTVRSNMAIRTANNTTILEFRL